MIVALEFQVYGGGTMVIVLVGPHHIYAGQIGWGIGQQHK